MSSFLPMFYALSFLTALIAFLFALYLYLWVKRQKVENKEIERISLLIKQGADTFLRREYKLLAAFAGIAALVILLFFPQPVWRGDIISNVMSALSYIAGTVLSALAGKIGILVATLSNSRCAESAQKGLKDAFLVGFRGGSVMGLLVVGCSLAGVAAVLMITGDTTILLARHDHPARILLRCKLPCPLRKGWRRNLHQDG